MVPKTKEYWFDGRGIKDDDDTIVSAVYNTRFDTILFKPEHIKDIHPPSKFKIAAFVENLEDVQDINEVDVVVSMSVNCLKSAQKNGIMTALYSVIKDEKTMNEVSETSPNFDYCIVELLEETNIPIELLIAKLQNTDTKILKKVDNTKAAKIVLGVLEAGSDGILMSTNDVSEIFKSDKMIDEFLKGKMDIVEASVESIEHLGMGERACLDASTLLTKKEGMIIGSTAAGGILLCSETHPLPYMDTRPFRVNAGAVHSYVWCPNNLLKYITDLKAGSKVLCIDTKGVTREVSIGRVKIETRPQLLIKANAKGVDINVIVQDDWHVRVFGNDGKPRNVTTLRKGDKVLAYISEPGHGRHVGIEIEERLEEV